MKAAFAEPEIITRKGKPVSVIIPIKDYQALLERLEDAEDVAYLKKARSKTMQYRPLADVLADLSKK
jgi:PHD/YefM family antitoxin component YafN of YafNO toxin-antitoxin module